MKANQTMTMNNIGLAIFILFWCGLVVLSSLYMTIPLLHSFQEEFHLTSNQAAWVGSVFSIFFSLGCLFFGIMSERLGMKRVMVWGLVCLSLLTFLVGFSNSYYQLLFLRGLQGLAAATFSPVALTYVGIVFPSDKRSTAIGFISFGFLLAGIVGQLVSSYVEVLAEWRAAFYFFGVTYVLAAFMLLILPKDRSDQYKDLVIIIKKLALPFKDRQIVISYCIALTILLSFVGMYTALGTYLTNTFDFNEQQVFLVRVAGILGILLSPFSGFFSSKVGLFGLLRIGLCLSILGLLVMGFSTHLYVTIIMSVVFVSGISVIIPTMIIVVGKLGGSNRGIVTSVYTFFLFVGASLGPIVTTTLTRLGNASLPFSSLSGLLLVSLILSLFMTANEWKQVKEKTV
ncbi:MFS transporter [Bacillus sp. JCM 19034]|uniref:MFS transporter n=1 Tax=Bacillus sp. JCM 19034 TaxID=1481928 RepID=UPI000783A36C|nr:MFS transporter [Bacillus sp. JCM 19034]